MPLSMDRRHILNFTYYYDFGKLVTQRQLGWVVNGWSMSGVTNFQSGTIITSLMSSNFGLYGSLTLPVGTVANVAGYNNTSTCYSGSATTCSLQITSSSSLGTPDILLQPVAVGNPNGKTKHQYVDGSVFRLPALGQNGPTSYGTLRGPLYFNSDLNMSKQFRLGMNQNLRVQGSAFNFLNRANYTFSSLYPGGYSMNFTQTSTSTDLNQDLENATNQQSGFGSTPIRTGRRIMEISVRYQF
jgi:hypothetical protein